LPRFTLLAPTVLGVYTVESVFRQRPGLTTRGCSIPSEWVVRTAGPTPLMSLEVYGRVFMQIGIATAVIAVLMLLTAPKLNRMTQDDDTAEKGSKAATV
ncbi:dipeptide/tripeptide permease, partial [Salmonella enterica]